VARLLALLPTYDGRRANARAMVEMAMVGNLDVLIREIQGSLLAFNFNQGWAFALDANPDFVLLLHDDIVPAAGNWLQIMFEELTLNRAGVVSVVSPIKTAAGLTSTAIETADPWHPRRLSMTEVFQKPETWTEPGLLLNTGLALIDFRQEWVRDPNVFFTINDRIVRKPDGSYVAEVQPEDWNWSRAAAAAGARLFATRKVVIQHIGRAEYMNDAPWGLQETDPVWAEVNK